MAKGCLGCLSPPSNLEDEFLDRDGTIRYCVTKGVGHDSTGKGIDMNDWDLNVECIARGPIGEKGEKVAKKAGKKNDDGGDPED